MQVVIVLQHRPHRFNDPKRQVNGIFQQMLTRTLKLLERDGLVGRKVLGTLHDNHRRYDAHGEANGDRQTIVRAFELEAARLAFWSAGEGAASLSFSPRF